MTAVLLELDTRIERLEEVAERWDKPGDLAGRRIARRARDKADGMRVARRLIAAARATDG